MKVLLVDPHPNRRCDLVAMLQASGISVSVFTHPRTAFLFLLARLSEVDGVLVNDDEGDWSHWLRTRVELLSAPLPVASYSARLTEPGSAIHDGASVYPDSR